MSTRDVIYIIDDDQIYQFTTKKALEILGFQNKIKSFLDGEEAMNFISNNIENEEELPDIIFLDINMPIMNGYEFLDEFLSVNSKFTKKVTIHLVSSSVDQVDIDKAEKNSHIASYITKPIKIEKLKTILDNF